MEAVDWRIGFSANAREKIVNKIADTLRKRFPCSEGHTSELKNIAVKLEEKAYMAARDQKEYLRKIALEMTEGFRPNVVPSSSSSNPPYSGLNSSNPVGNQGQSIAVQSTDQSQAREQHSLPNIPNNIASAGVSANLAPARPIVRVSAQVPLPNIANENPNSQSILGNSQKSVRNSSGHGTSFNVSANNLREEQGRQHSPHIDTQQNHEQLNPHLRKQFKQENIAPSCITQQKQLQHHQHHQEKLLKPTQKQTSQQSVMQTPFLRSCKMHVAPLSDLRQDQISSFEQPSQSAIENYPHTAFRQANKSQEAPDIHQNVSSIPEHLLMQSQKQPHVIGTKLTATNIQQNHLNEQSNGVHDLQQKQQRIPCQQNNAQQQFLGQKINLSIARHDQLGQRNSISMQLLGTQCSSSGMQGETGQTASDLLPNQGKQSQPQSLERQLISQSQPEKMQQLSNPSEQDQQQTCQTSGTLTSTFEKQISHLDNWQEEVYGKVESLKSKFLTPLKNMLQKIHYMLQQLNSVPQHPQRGNIEKIKASKNILINLIRNLNVPKSKITLAYEEKLGALEKSIVFVLHTYGRGKPVPSLQHGQPSSDVHYMRQSVQLHSQTPQVQTHKDEKKPQLSLVNLQRSATMQRSNVTNVVNDSRPLSEPPTLEHDMTYLKKNLTEQDSEQENSLNLVQQVSPGSIKVSTSSPQQPNVKTLLLRNHVHGQQSNVNPLESSFSTLHGMHLKQTKEQQDAQTPSPKQELQTHKMQEQLVQPKQKILQQHHQPVRLQSGAAFPNAMPKIPISSCQQVPQYSSQIDKKNMPRPLTKDRQVYGAPEAPSSVVISTPGICTSPILEESNNDIHCNTSTLISDELSASVHSIQRLIEVVNSMSSKALSASVLDIGSVVRTTDRISGSLPVRRSRAAIAVDLVADYHLQVKRCRSTLPINGVASATGSIGESLPQLSDMEKLDLEPVRRSRAAIAVDLVADYHLQVKRCRSTLPINGVASATGSIGESLPQLSDMEKLDLEPTALSHIKRPRVEENQTLLEEITAINQKLIDTVLDIIDEETPPTVASPPIKGGKGTIVRCSFIAVAISPDLMSEQVSAQMFPIQPLRLLVPENYPLCSPIFLDNLTVEVSDELEDLSAKVKSKLGISLRHLMEPFSLGEIVKAWAICARDAISEYARQHGGGNFSSKYGTWEDCLVEM